MEKALAYLTLIGVTDKHGNLIGRFDPSLSNNKIKKIKAILKMEDIMGLIPQIGSPVQIQQRKLAA